MIQLLVKPPAVKRLQAAVIDERLRNCSRLPSLGSINSVLRELVNAEQCFTSQMADVIRRDPSMTTRLLKLVNSVYYGLSLPVNSIEEAVFYLGVRQVRQLAMVTPVVEDLQRLAGRDFSWHGFWQHCVGTAILVPEILGDVQFSTDESDYVAGLLHDVGKIVMAAAFPEHFTEVQHLLAEGHGDILRVEQEVLGMDHCELGAMYLKRHSVPEQAVMAAKYHHQPAEAPSCQRQAAAVQIADLLVRHAEIGSSGNPAAVSEEDWSKAIGWEILFPSQLEDERSIAKANLGRCLERLPAILEGLV